MSATKTSTESAVKKAVRELTGLRTGDRGKAAELNHCHRCCRRRA